MRSLFYLLAAWTVATFWLIMLTTRLLPNSPASQNIKEILKFPSSLEELKLIASSLITFKMNHPVYVHTLFFSAYLYKQTFAIPGSVFLNLLSGALYGPLQGTIICSVLTACGASMCYFLSLISGAEMIMRRWPDRLTQLRRQVDSNKKRLPFFLLSLRLVPVTPNWFINMTSPVLGIPITVFAATALLGLVPYNYMCVKAGSVLSQLNSLNDLLTMQTFGNLCILAAVSSLPGLLNNKLEKVVKSMD